MRCAFENSSNLFYSIRRAENIIFFKYSLNFKEKEDFFLYKFNFFFGRFESFKNLHNKLKFTHQNLSSFHKLFPTEASDKFHL